MRFIALDFPEFERPTMATSAPLSSGKPLASAALVKNLACMMVLGAALAGLSALIGAGP
jgi:hypothetical protein